VPLGRSGVCAEGHALRGPTVAGRRKSGHGGPFLGAHVVLTNDSGMIMAKSPIAHVGLAVMRPSELVASMTEAAAREGVPPLGVAAGGSLSACDSHKYVHIVTLAGLRRN